MTFDICILALGAMYLTFALCFLAAWLEDRKRMYLAEDLKATDFCSRFIKKKEDNDHE